MIFEIFQFIRVRLHSFASTCADRNGKILYCRNCSVINSSIASQREMAWHRVFDCSCAPVSGEHTNRPENTKLFVVVVAAIGKLVNLNLIRLWLHQTGCNFSGYVVDFRLVGELAQRCAGGQ